MSRGIRAIGAHVPHRRLDRGQITTTFGTGGGQGTRAVASFDEDTTTMAVEAARAGDVRAGATPVMALWFATTDPAYLDKTNATAIHAALGLRAGCPALDFGGGLRSGIGAVNAALRATGDIIVAASDRRSGLPTSADESTGGDGAGAIRVGDDADGPLLATFVADASATEELLDRWRAPGDDRSRSWEERFAESVYVDLAVETFGRALATAGLTAADVDVVITTGMHGRAVSRAAAKLGVATVADNLDATVGNTGIAQPFLTLASVLEGAEPGQTIAIVHLADGCDVIVLRTTDDIADWSPRRSITDQIAGGGDISYGRFLAWRGQVTVEPPNRPGPARVSAPAAQRRQDWKFRFTGSRDRTSGMVHLPPARRVREGRRGRRHGRHRHGRRGRHRRGRHGRPAGVLTQPARRVRGGRLRRWWSGPARAHRRRRRLGRCRRSGGTHLPAALHRRRHPQLLLEGAAVLTTAVFTTAVSPTVPGKDRAHG